MCSRQSGVVQMGLWFWSEPCAADWTGWFWSCCRQEFQSTTQIILVILLFISCWCYFGIVHFPSASRFVLNVHLHTKTLFRRHYKQWCLEPHSEFLCEDINHIDWAVQMHFLSFIDLEISRIVWDLSAWVEPASTCTCLNDTWLYFMLWSLLETEGWRNS